MRQIARVFLLLFLLAPLSALAQGALLKNGGFEGGAGVAIPDWQPFESGYDVDRQTKRGGEQSLRCDNANAATKRGAQAVITLNQKVAAPIVITGWSRADAVSGIKNSDYSLYADVRYVDGTPQWGYSAPFRTGTHDWEQRRLTIFPQKPIQYIAVYALFRSHSGTAWFDDFYAREISGAGVFDGQKIAPPTRHSGSGTPLQIAAKDGLGLTFSGQGDLLNLQSGGQTLATNAAGGFFARDVNDDGPLIALRGTAAKRKTGTPGLEISGANGDLRLRYTLKITQERDALAIDGEITDVNRDNRALSVYLVLPIDATGWQWGQDVRTSETIAPNQEVTNQTQVNVGATGGLSRYPFGVISNNAHGIGIASQQDWPSVYRIFYNGASRQFVIAWDFALTRTLTWPAYNARFRCHLFRLPPPLAKWGFRAAAQRFYRLHPEGYTRRARAEGIWLPFTDPATIAHAEDFHFAYHEGDNSLPYDDAHQILSFRYTEPATYWLPMPPETPRTYENALALITDSAGIGDRVSGVGNADEIQNPKSKITNPATPDTRHPTPAESARAVLNSGTWDEDGKFNLEFRNEPWNNGAVFPLNPNPELLATPEKPTKASLSYNFEMAAKMYGKDATGTQDGEYLDSLEGWGDVLDYRPSNLQALPYPPPFATDSRRPVVPEWYAVHTFARFLRDDLRGRDKLLFANATPIRFSIFAPLLDVMGIEINWLDANGNWNPEDDATLNYRRTLSGGKPCLLLMNSDFSKLNYGMVERYFQRSLFYGMFPSMFSANAADHAYWETPALYNRDRPLFQKYIPLIQRISAAGWEPITYARSSNPAVFLERYGTHFLTVHNDSPSPQSATITIDAAALGLKAALTVHNLVTGLAIPSTTTGGVLHLTLALAADETALLEIR